MQTHQAGPTLEITLIQERSAGTFARVYLARVRDPKGLTRVVAVKVLKKRWSNTDEVLDRTRDEAQLLASLQHQNIVRVEAITEIDGQPAILMEFVHGVDLGQLASALDDRNLTIPHKSVYEIVERITSALAAAYFKIPIGLAEPLRVVHRDLKPSNIMVTTEGSLRVLDFGTARFEDEERIARTQEIRFGSLKYMSPERREGDRGDHVSDIYSLGLLTIELLQGRGLGMLPIDQSTHDEAIQSAIDAIPALGLPNTGWDNSLRETLGRMCAFLPEHRLDARQAMKLFRAFKEQAAGHDLATFAESVIHPITNSLHAIPDMDDSKGAKFWLNTADQTSVMERKAAESLLNELPTELGQHGVDIVLKDGMPVEAFEPANETEEVPRVMAPLPGFASRDLTTEEFEHNIDDPSTDDFPTDPGAQEWPKARETDPGPITTPRARPLPPAQAAPAQRSPKRWWIIGCVAVASATICMVLAGVLLWKNLNTGTQDAEPSPSDVLSASMDVAKVQLQSGAPTVQWIRLHNEAGERVLTAKPDASGSLPLGTYQLSVKVVTVSAVTAELKLTEDLSLECKPATMGRVRCTKPNGTVHLLLAP